MTGMHDELRDLIAPVALGAASDDEVIRVEAHVRDCAPCREELSQMRAAADLLALAPEDVEPPASLRGRVMAQVRAEAAPAGADLPPAAAAPEAPSSARDRVEGGRWWRTLLKPWPATAVAMAAVAAALLVWNVSLQVDSSPGEPVMIAAVSGGHDAPQMTGRIMYVAQEDALVMQLHGLEPLPPDQAYQVWTIHDGIPVSAGTFVPDHSGRATVVASGAAGAEAVAHTAQAHDQTDTPVGPLLMSAPLTT